MLRQALQSILNTSPLLASHPLLSTIAARKVLVVLFYPPLVSIELSFAAFEAGMETRSSSRRRSALPASPVKQVRMAGATKGSVKKSTRKVLGDRTNSAPVAGFMPSPKKAVMSQIEEHIRTPSSKKSPLTLRPSLTGEDVLRSQVHKQLTMTLTPANGLSVQSPDAETPQFRIPLAPYEDSPLQEVAAEVAPHEDSPRQEVAAEVAPYEDIPLQEAAAEVHTPSVQEKVDQAKPEDSAQSAVTVVSRLSREWVGRDVDEVTVCGEDDDSDCSVVVHVSSPGTTQQDASPVPVVGDTVQTVDFSAIWQQRETSQKVKVQENHFSYYGEDDGEDYEGCEYEDEQLDQDCDELCKGISRISVAEVSAGLPEHKGRHIRFNYNSDDEIEEEEVEVMRLRGLPTPRGRHLRFPEDNDVSSP